MDRRLHVARAELVLAQSDDRPLREVPLRPDPLTPFAHVFGELREDLGESASVVIDLMPVTPAMRRRKRHRHQVDLPDRLGEALKELGVEA